MRKALAHRITNPLSQINNSLIYIRDCMHVRNIDMEIRIYELDYNAPQRDFIAYSMAVKYKWSHKVFKV